MVLVEALLLAEVAEGADVGEAEAKAKLVFVADGAEGEAAVFEGGAAAVPVVGGLDSGVLQEAEIGVEAEARSATEAAFVGVAVSKQDAELVEILLYGTLAGQTGQGLDKGVAASEGEIPQTVVDQHGAGIGAAFFEIVIEIPLGIGLSTALHAHPRNQGGQMLGSGQESDAGEI